MDALFRQKHMRRAHRKCRD